MKLKNYIIVCLLVCLCIGFSFYIKNKLDSAPYNSRDFISSVRKIYNLALKQYKIDKSLEYNGISYQKGLSLYTSTDIKPLNINNDSLKYLIKFNKDGRVSYLKVVEDKNEIELGDTDENSVVLYSDIVKTNIKHNDDFTNELFEIISKDDKSNITDKGYTIEGDDNDCYINIYLGKVTKNSYFKVDNVLNNEGRYLISLSTYINNTQTNRYISPCIKIKIYSKPTTLTVEDITNGTIFEEIKGDK